MRGLLIGASGRRTAGSITMSEESSSARTNHNTALHSFNHFGQRFFLDILFASAYPKLEVDQKKKKKCLRKT